MNHGNVEAALTLLRNHLAAGHMVVLATTELASHRNAMLSLIGMA